MESTGLARFLFELASEERLGILAAISEKPLRHAQIARRVRMTDSETTRHLNRLTAAGLVRKGPQSEYVPTNLARLVSADFPFFSFLLAYREFLLNHDVLDGVAGVCFPNLHGEVDMATMVFLDDGVGCKWAEDLFLHFWNEARERLDAPTLPDG